MANTFCMGGDGPCEGKERYRIERTPSGFQLKRKPPMFPGIAEWNVKKHGAWCKPHGEQCARRQDQRLARGAPVLLTY